jgi:SAM-dependent methyltransferase
MRRELLDLLRCPACRAALRLEGDPDSGTLFCTGCRASYPIVRSIPRFVPQENYAGTFGFQWNRFPKTQLDSHSGHPITAERFFGQSGWPPEEMKGKRVLDVGCGAGRFAEVALGTGAHVVAIDYSAAVDAAHANLAGRGNIDFVQADAFRLPFAEGSFDYVYCFGVLQHTPDPEAAFLSIVKALKPDGRIAIDLYPKLWKNVLWPKYWLRPLTRRMSRERLFRLVERCVPWLLPVSRALGRIPLAGRQLRYVVPVMNYEGVYPLSDTQLREWAVLDTFDMLSPAHDHPQTAATLRKWLEEAQLVDGEVFRRGFLVARGRKRS